MAYGGESQLLAELAQPILLAAHKYQLLQVVHICEKEIAGNICEQNSINLFIFADTFQLVKLKAKAMEIVNQLQNPTKHEDWMVRVWKGSKHLLKNCRKWIGS